VLYCASPNSRLRGVKSVIPGGLLAVGVWLLASAWFAYYVANFGFYNRVYGALGAVVVFLIWLWISNLVILLGAEVDAERERIRQLGAGTPGAERELKLRERSVPKPGKRSRTTLIADQRGTKSAWCLRGVAVVGTRRICRRLGT
jgi:membrane protein